MKGPERQDGAGYYDTKFGRRPESYPGPVELSITNTTVINGKPKTERPEPDLISARGTIRFGGFSKPIEPGEIVFGTHQVFEGK